MSSFQSYTGEYSSGGRRYRWRCYATARVYELRRADHVPLPPAPEGKAWAWRSQREGEPQAAWLVDADLPQLSHMLVQFEPLGDLIERPEPRHVEIRAQAEAL